MSLHARVNVPDKVNANPAARSDHRSRFKIYQSDDSTIKKFSYDVAVIGLGYVGLPLCLAFAKSGLAVLGIDSNPEKCDQIKAGKSYIKHISDTAVASEVETDRLSATTDYSCLADAAAILICVPTPLDSHRSPDLSFVVKTSRVIGDHLRPGQLVVLESTTYPGTTEDLVRPILESGSGLIAGRDFHLAFSPEREDPGNLSSGFKYVPKVVGALTQPCLNRATDLYEKIVGTVVPVENCKVAEAAKLTENIFRSVNIALVNELKVIFAAMGIDVWQVIDAAATKPFGYMPFYPGPGLGGHCIPIDPSYLTWKAAALGQRTRLIDAADEINRAMPQYVVDRIVVALNAKSKSVRGAKILLLGLAYKADVDDDRESPAYEIVRLLCAAGAKMFFNDPYVAKAGRDFAGFGFLSNESQPIDSSYDLIVVCTAHSKYKEIDFETIGLPVVDCRNLVSRGYLERFAA